VDQDVLRRVLEEQPGSRSSDAALFSIVILGFSYFSYLSKARSVSYVLSLLGERRILKVLGFSKFQ